MFLEQEDLSSSPQLIQYMLLECDPTTCIFSTHFDMFNPKIACLFTLFTHNHLTLCSPDDARSEIPT